MVALPWDKIINIFSTFRNMINLLVSQKNCINCKKLWSVSSSNLTTESLFSFTVIESTAWKPKFCYISFPTWQLFKTVYIAFREFFETSALKILRIPPWSLETNISGTFQTKIRAYFFPLHVCKDLPPKTRMLNWKTFMLVIFLLPVSLFNLYCIPNHKSALLISFWFVLSATSGFISKLADLALSSTSFLIKFALNNLEKVSRLSARKGTIRLFVWHVFKKTVTLGGLVGPSELNKDDITGVCSNLSFSWLFSLRKTFPKLMVSTILGQIFLTLVATLSFSTQKCTQNCSG